MANPKERFFRLYDLGPERLAQVDDMLLKGKSAKEVAVYIQKEWGVYGEIATDSFAKQIQRYRTNELDPKLAVAAGRIDNSVEGRQALQKFTKNLDILTELCDMMRVQKARVYKALERENNLPLLLGDVRQELKLYFEMGKTISDLQLETGILRRAPRQVAGLFQMLVDEGASAQKDFEASVQSRGNFRKMVDMFFTDNPIPDEAPKLLN